MSGELQTIPARHGVATFVPRGRTIKIINTYGKQVVSTWAFALAAPPENGEVEESDGDIGEEVDELKEQVQVDHVDKNSGNDTDKNTDHELKETEIQGSHSKNGDAESMTNADTFKKEVKLKEEEESGKSETKSGENSLDPPEQTARISDTESNPSKPEKRTWSSYLPSIPYRSKNPNQAAGATGTKTKQQEKAERAYNEATSKKWSSYLPTGKGFSSYVPNLQMPDTQGVVSAFKSSNSWDPNKSYAEQLYDFSKTPVGAGTLAAASGSGTASSLYAAYSAYTKLNPSKIDQPPMEYLSLPHTRATSTHVIPEINDTLLTNLRNPLMTLIEDTSTGAHDTLTAACDANMYAALGVEKPEEHGSCAENLVLALKELNEKAGLKGTKAVGADITVNIAPTPLHLFMNAPLRVDRTSQENGTGAKGTTFSVEEPKCKKRSFVRFRAERDIVVVMSACPNDVGPQNGGKCMAANFTVEEAEDDSYALKSVSNTGGGSSKKQLNTLQKQGGEQEQDLGIDSKVKDKSAPQDGSQSSAAPAGLASSAGRTEEVSASGLSQVSDTKPRSEDAMNKGQVMPKQPGDQDGRESQSYADEKEKATDAKPTDKSILQKEPKTEQTEPAEVSKPKKKPKKLERRSATPKGETS